MYDTWTNCWPSLGPHGPWADIWSTSTLYLSLVEIWKERLSPIEGSFVTLRSPCTTNLLFCMVYTHDPMNLYSLWRNTWPASSLPHYYLLIFHSLLRNSCSTFHPPQHVFLRCPSSWLVILGQDWLMLTQAARMFLLLVNVRDIRISFPNSFVDQGLDIATIWR